MQARDQHPEDGEELALGEQVGLAGFPDHVGDLGHALVHRQGLGLHVLHQAEHGADGADDDAEYISVVPLMPPSPSNFTWDRSGILMSASLPKAAVEAPRRAIVIAPRYSRFRFLIK